MGLTGQEIAEAIWLTQQTASAGDTVQVPASTSLEEENRIEPPGSSPPTDQDRPDFQPESQAEIVPTPVGRSPSLALPPSYTTISVPDASALSQSLRLARALRPLARQIVTGLPQKLDETATVDAVAETKVWHPVLKPDSELWFDAALVFDTSPSMCLWQRLGTDLHRLLARYGEFRDVRIWRLKHVDGAVQLTSRRGVPHRPKELLIGDRRRLIIIVSDCVAPTWYNGKMQALIAIWSAKLPTVVFHVFPERLWSRTVLVQSVSVKFKARQEGLPSNSLHPLIRSIWDEERLRASLNRPNVRIPVVSLEQDSLASWAQVVAGNRQSRVVGVVWNAEDAALVPSTPAMLDIEALTDTFMLTASPMARELAGLLASAPVITLPVIRLIRRSMLPHHASAVHDAEVLMSGLLQVSSHEQSTFENAEDIAYEIVNEQVRERLRADLSNIDALTVIEKVSKYVARGLGKSVSEFKALLKTPTTSKIPEEAGFLSAFATVTATILRRLGDEFCAIADALALPPEETEDVEEPDDWLADFPLETFEYEVSEYLNFPPLQTLDIIDAQLDTIVFPPPLQAEEVTVITLAIPGIEPELVPFEFTVASLQRRSGQPQSTEWDIHRQQQSANRLLERLSEDVALEMVLIPRGTFLMGSPEDESERSNSESPQHAVTVEPFLMGRYLVTQAQWRRVAKLPRIQRALKSEPSRFKGDNRSVESVSWHEAVEFCARLSAHTDRQYRLPSEAEWEYACRANTPTPFHFGDIITTDVANYNGRAYAGGPQGNHRGETTPVNHFGIANAFGLSDMHGNVWEWCQDIWHDTYEGAPTDGSAWITGGDKRYKMRRGGSWDAYPSHCRSASRYYSKSDSRYSPLGFRVVCTATRKQATSPEPLS